MISPRSAYWILIVLSLSLGTTSCKKNNATEPSGLPAGRTDVTIFKNTVVGYIVSSGTLVARPYPPDQQPDFEISIERDASMTPVGLCMSSSRPTFALAGSFGQSDSARAFFNSLASAIDSGLARTTCDTATPPPHMPSNQVWTVKTRENKYAKLLIVANFVFVPRPDSTGITTRFDWVYQPDGTPNF